MEHKNTGHSFQMLFHLFVCLSVFCIGVAPQHYITVPIGQRRQAQTIKTCKKHSSEWIPEYKTLCQVPVWQNMESCELAMLLQTQ